MQPLRLALRQPSSNPLPRAAVPGCPFGHRLTTSCQHFLRCNEYGVLRPASREVGAYDTAVVSNPLNPAPGACPAAHAYFPRFCNSVHLTPRGLGVMTSMARVLPVAPTFACNTVRARGPSNVTATRPFHCFCGAGAEMLSSDAALKVLSAALTSSTSCGIESSPYPVWTARILQSRPIMNRCGIAAMPYCCAIRPLGSSSSFRSERVEHRRNVSALGREIIGNPAT